VNNRRAALDVLRRGVASRVFPGASAEIGTAASPVWRGAVGALTYDDPDAPRVDRSTLFDLASLTKPIVTTTIAMRLVEGGSLSIDNRVAEHQAGWRGDDRSAVTVRNLLEHASGLPAWAPLWRGHAGRDAVVAAALETPLAYEPGTQSLYSDLGFIVLGAVLEDAGWSTLDALFGSVSGAWCDDDSQAVPLLFNPRASLKTRAAPTRYSPDRDRMLVGEVDDDNAWAMGGVAGHAGLFGTAAAVGVFARLVLRALAHDDEARHLLAGPETLLDFLAPSPVPGSSRALGWDLMRPASSCGSRMSARAFGHTGFTGTSLWIDPARDFYAVLLTNRVHPEAGPGEPMQEVRRAFHNAWLEDRAG
jgi:CubicO group peptidase (beta-lactamase class C family)